MSLQTNQRGFTIVELLIVIVVIAILAAISIVAYTGIQTRARNSAAFSLASQISKKAEAYYAINGTYPITATNFNDTTNKEPNLEGAKVTFSNGASAAPASITTATFNSVAGMLDQFNSGSRVIYIGATGGGGYKIIYLKDSSTGSIDKGTILTTPAYVFGTNEG